MGTFTGRQLRGAQTISEWCSRSLPPERSPFYITSRVPGMGSFLTEVYCSRATGIFTAQLPRPQQVRAVARFSESAAGTLQPFTHLTVMDPSAVIPSPH